MQPSKETASSKPVVPILHVTVSLNALERMTADVVQGHSLGASYACFCFAQILSQKKSHTANSGQLGDIYTFGCPRVGHSDWSKAFFDAMASHTGISVRIVNQQDLVPQLVPVIFRDSAPYYNHVDSGWNVFPDNLPAAIPTERGTFPPGLDWIWNWSRDLGDHRMILDNLLETVSLTLNRYCKLLRLIDECFEIGGLRSMLRSNCYHASANSTFEGMQSPPFAA
jgi:hypothetical protein